jgi:hypothetical protein
LRFTQSYQTKMPLRDDAYGTHVNRKFSDLFNYQL